MPAVFDFDDYKKYLLKLIEANKSQRSYRSVLAARAQCHRTFLSRIFSEPLDLTLEQAANLAEFLNLSSLETDYFLELVNYSRSGNTRLKSVVRRRLHDLRKANSDLGRKIDSKQMEDSLNKSKYYSSWVYSAVHMLVSIPEFRSIEAIVRRLGVSQKLVSRIVDDLVSFGLIEKDGGKYIDVGNSLHVRKQSTEFASFYGSWHQMAAEDLLRNPDALHYVGIHSLSKQTAVEFRKKMNEFLKEIHGEIEKSPSEELVCLKLDYFLVGQ